MSRPAARRLPGIRFEIQAPPVTDALPRMDVAAFVGFAASGPLHVPVVVEDVADFEAVFGSAPLLAWDAERGEPVHAQLESAVRAFFRNGGQRCWVVRVAGPEALANSFPVPGLLRRSARGELSPALARARSEGSWSDAVQVAASITVEPLELLERPALDGQVVLTVTAPGGVAVGDLLRVHFGGTGVMLLVAVESVEMPGRAPTGTPVSLALPLVTARVRTRLFQWLQEGVGLAPDTSAVSWMRGEGDTESIPVTDVADPGKDVSPRLLTLTLKVAPEQAPPPGAVLRVQSGGSECWLPVQAVEEELQPGLGTGSTVKVSGLASQVLLSPPAVSSAPARCERLTLSLWTRQGAQKPAGLEQLGFCPPHPRHWGALPMDAERARWEDSQLAPSRRPEERLPQDWRQGVPEARFPLAGPASGKEGFSSRPELAGQPLDWKGDFSFPLGLTDQPTAYVGCTPPAGDALERDGLSTFSAELFLDEGLKGLGPETLLDEAGWLRDLSSKPRALRGIHAVLDRDEVSLVAVPDAAHRPWERVPGPDASSPAPAAPLKEPAWGTFLGCALQPLPLSLIHL
ncbi:hypothetical protein D7Y21_30445, partial [Corallococcus sp. AB045]